ncbi:midasin [Caerostris extrusa]|uniref:Midasin n=1 Tax=Caerostris extrusa TaxID=172846 RepID=A0AAV4MIM2_CAEEX|nr:midasin [Caerostris extrusa]
MQQWKRILKKKRQKLPKIIQYRSLELVREFSPRLSILHTFLQQFKISKALVHRKLTAVLLNIYHYYEQFLPDVKNRISQIRKPIDKELKDFVKIARWNDINFEALKQSVKKSHRCFKTSCKKKKIFTIPSKKDLETSDGPSWALNIKEKDFLLKSEEKEHLGSFLESVTIDSGKNICTRSQEKKQILLLIQKKKQMLSTLFKKFESYWPILWARKNICKE